MLIFHELDISNSDIRQNRRPDPPFLPHFVGEQMNVNQLLFISMIKWNRSLPMMPRNSMDLKNAPIYPDLRRNAPCGCGR
jgi:hypothetical protein